MQFRLSLLIITSIITTAHAEPHLFTAFPQLQEKIPYIPLCDLPTPMSGLKILVSISVVTMFS